MLSRMQQSNLITEIRSELLSCFCFELTERILPSLLVSCMLSIPGRAAATRRNSCGREETTLLEILAVSCELASPKYHDSLFNDSKPWT